MINKVRVDRESVCMGDDCDSHESVIEIISPLTISGFVDKILEIRYLPYISGGLATWVMKSHRKPLAVIALSVYEPECVRKIVKLCVEDVCMSELIDGDSDKEIFFSYYAQQDYMKVYEENYGCYGLE